MRRAGQIVQRPERIEQQGLQRGSVMFFKRCATACVGAALSLAVISYGSDASAADLYVKAKPPEEAPLFLVNNNTVSYSYAFSATDPFVGKTAKQVFSFTHFDIWTYGTNFFNIDVLKSDLRDPAAPCGGPPPNPALGCEGATEVYGFLRSTFGWKQIFGMTFSGPLTNISFKIGADANTENNYVGPAKRDEVVGLQFDFDLPLGANWQVSPLIYSEKNHNGFITLPTSGVTRFQTTWRVESLFAVPVGPKGTPITFFSIAGINGPKGPGAPFQPSTKVEAFTQQKLSLDVGQAILNKPGRVSVWAAYTYWYNKFGIDHTLDPTGGSIEKTAVLGVTAAF
jgi:hypothetical protein